MAFTGFFLCVASSVDSDVEAWFQAALGVSRANATPIAAVDNSDVLCMSGCHLMRHHLIRELCGATRRSLAFMCFRLFRFW